MSHVAESIGIRQQLDFVRDELRAAEDVWLRSRRGPTGPGQSRDDPCRGGREKKRVLPEQSLIASSTRVDMLRALEATLARLVAEHETWLLEDLSEAES